MSTGKAKPGALPATLAQAHELMPRLMPAPTAPGKEWLAFRRRSAEIYRQVADIDRGHHHEALYWAELENHPRRRPRPTTGHHARGDADGRAAMNHDHEPDDLSVDAELDTVLSTDLDTVLGTELDPVLGADGSGVLASVAILRTTGTVLRQLRRARGLGLAQAAQQCQVSASVLCRVELTRREPRLSLLLTLCDVLGVRLSAVVRLAEDEALPLGGPCWTDDPADLLGWSPLHCSPDGAMVPTQQEPATPGEVDHD